MVPVKQTQLYSCKNPSNSSQVRLASSPLAACAAIAELRSYSYTDSSNHRYTIKETVTSCGTSNCSFDATQTCVFASGSGASCGSSTYTGIYSFSGPVTDWQCPTGATQVGSGASSQCMCNLGFAPSADGQKCDQYTCPPSGGYSAVTTPDVKVANAGDTVCTAGCSYQPSSYKVGQDGQIWGVWPLKSTGGFCGGAKDPATGADTGELNNNPAPVPCGQNQCPGTVNGATICVPCKNQVEQGPSTSASAPAGSSSAPVGTSTSTSCNGITCTTTTTGTDGSGTSTTQNQDSFCKQNPESSLCTKSSFGGSCSATTCNGDAVQCAIAAEQYRRNCQWFEDPQAQGLKESGVQAMNGVAQPEGHPGKDPEQVTSSLSAGLDQSDAIGGGGSCPSDVSVPLQVPLVGSVGLDIAFSKACDSLQAAGRVLVAITLLWAGLFVYRGASA